MTTPDQHNVQGTTRSEWMSTVGNQLYGTWGEELLAACNTPEFWAEYRDAVVQKYPGIKNGAVLSPDSVFWPLTDKDSGMIRAVDQQAETRDQLLAMQDEIMEYTSAADFIHPKEHHKNKVERTPEEAVGAHSHDGLDFAIMFSAGMANDVFLEHSNRVKYVLDTHSGDKYHMSDDPERLRSAGEQVLAEVKAFMGKWWDPSLESEAHSADSVHDMYEMHKLVFLERALRNPSFIACLNILSVTGFDVLGDATARPVEFSLGRSIGDRSQYGWQNRALRFGLDPYREGGLAFAILAYNLETDAFSVRPETVAFLREALRTQNRQGLGEVALKTAGNLQYKAKKGAFSRGCPVAGEDVMGDASRFASKAIAELLDLQGEFARR